MEPPEAPSLYKEKPLPCTSKTLDVSKHMRRPYHKFWPDMRRVAVRAVALGFIGGGGAWAGGAGAGVAAGGGDFATGGGAALCCTKKDRPLRGLP